MSEGVSLQDSATGVTVEFDREQAFLLFTTFCGDAERTAHALGVSPVAVLRMADAEGWTSKLANIMEQMRSAKPGDVERGVNRALNFVQAHKFRMFLERICKKMYGWTDEEMEESLNPETNSKTGSTKKFTTRPMADLASALEKCHVLTYSALNDTAPERARRAGDMPGGASEDLHAQISAAMAKAGGSRTPRAMLFDAQLVQGAEQAQTIKKRVVVSDDSHTDDSGG